MLLWCRLCLVIVSDSVVGIIDVRLLLRFQLMFWLFVYIMVEYFWLLVELVCIKKRILLSLFVFLRVLQLYFVYSVGQVLCIILVLMLLCKYVLVGRYLLKLVIQLLQLSLIMFFLIISLNQVQVFGLVRLIMLL